MQEASTAPAVDVDPGWNITDLVVRAATTAPHRVAYSRLVGRRWQDVTAAQFRDEAAALAKGLIASGIEVGARVGILSRTRYEWTLVDTAIWFAGAVSVPVYETSSRAQMEWICSDAAVSAIFVEHGDNARLVRQTMAGSGAPCWVFDDGALADLVAAGARVSDDELERRRSHAGLDDLATLIYTSGTTGRPKGCELTHGNFVMLAEGATAALGEIVAVEGASTLLVLPLAHVFARFIEVLCMSSGARLAHCSDPNDLLEHLGQVQPTFILTVPRIFEKVYNGAEQKAEAAGKGKLFRAAAETAIAYSRALDQGRVPLALRARYAVLNRLVLARVRAVFGGRLTHAVSGGGPLGERLGHFYRGAGLNVLEGYGLTETTAPSTVNMPGRTRIGSVGVPLPGVSVRIDGSGEVLVKGPHVFRGYWNNPQATEEAFVDGWFHSGDLGAIDDDGYLRITGRSKEIIVTAGGKNVAPAALEDTLRGHPLISQCMVVGDGKPYIAAVLTLDPDMLGPWAANAGLGELDLASAARNEDVRLALQSAVDDANASVSKAESIRRFVVLDTDFTVESGHLTPSMKLKRDTVLRDHGGQIEEMYAQPR